MLKLAGARLLEDSDAREVRSVLEADPVAACMVAARFETAGLHPWRLGGELWGFGGLDGLCFSGVNLIPLQGDATAMRAFADRALSRRRVCSSLVGPSEQVLGLWSELASGWGPPREIRPEQPVMVLDTPPQVDPDPLVRRVRPDELDRYLPAAIAMFTEEVGIDPCANGGAAGYRARVAELIAGGRAFARFDGDEVVFKAEIGALSRSVGQIQGVWVHPDRRSCGLGTRGTAAVAERLSAIGRTASLYVNGFNVAARIAYRKIGFEERGVFATVLF
ncbi:GNAT family N-acetyltransferase [Allosaccharopolyspora coralli]|uniref:GNAT family N-acetyltransferase n=1 Tax=Allosaccharopolyspora coralli TaxID=2665642 RepID=A0A5Q3QHS4_9PSEU|nr:GNAT family N-acetyltransferase [Allosaccharopolyspora coralli]QGK71009.1 GNAT family N-acetyltransferase [Allosaccharopolyspora coralli]